MNVHGIHFGGNVQFHILENTRLLDHGSHCMRPYGQHHWLPAKCGKRLRRIKQQTGVGRPDDEQPLMEDEMGFDQGGGFGSLTMPATAPCAGWISARAAQANIAYARHNVHRSIRRSKA